MLGQTAAGLQDTNHCLSIDPVNSYAYKSLGIYHFENGEFEEAFQLFAKTKALDNTT